MIAWLLKELEKNPTGVFRKKDLLKKSKKQFEQLKRQRFLTFVQPDPHHETYPCNLSCSNTCPMEVVEINGQLFAICPKDTEIDPIPLTKDDLSRYAFCLDTFLDQIRIANKIGGKCQKLGEHHIYLGYKNYDRKRAGFVFASGLGDATVLTLSGLKRVCREDYILIVLTLASQIEDVLLKEKLCQDNITQISLASSITPESFELPIEKFVSDLLMPAVKDEGLVKGDSRGAKIIATSWEQISVEIVDDETVKYKIGKERWKRANYADFGFMDKRKGLPNRLWPLFLDLARHCSGGYVHLKTPDNISKDMDRIRNTLRKFFGLQEIPIKYNKRVQAYYVKFHFTDKSNS